MIWYFDSIKVSTRTLLLSKEGLLFFFETVVLLRVFSQAFKLIPLLRCIFPENKLYYFFFTNACYGNFAGSELLKSTGMADSSKKGAEMIEKTLQNGAARKKFVDMLCSQGVDKSDAYSLFKESRDVLPIAQNKTEIKSRSTGIYLCYPLYL